MTFKLTCGKRSICLLPLAEIKTFSVTVMRNLWYVLFNDLVSHCFTAFEDVKHGFGWLVYVVGLFYFLLVISFFLFSVCVCPS